MLSVCCVQGDAPAAATPATASALASNPSKPMYCVIYMGGKLSRDTQEDKANCNMQNSGLKMMRGKARWTDPNLALNAARINNETV